MLRNYPGYKIFILHIFNGKFKQGFTVIPYIGMHALKLKYLEIDAALNNGFNAASKTANLGLNAAFNIEI